VLVIDPGELSEPAALDGADAVLITHEHFDHLDVGALTDALARRPQVRIFTHPQVMPKLGDLREVATAVTDGDEFTAAGFAVSVHGGLHAMIHPELPRVANNGYLVDGVYHPGDSFDVPAGAEVHTLFVPVSGSWLKLAESVGFIRSVAPRRAYALHDGLLNDVGHKVYGGNLSRLAQCDYARLASGETVRL
jgi:L-ascorbate metabolism protein UlaG (beta-lactamase superfamily)